MGKLSGVYNLGLVLASIWLVVDNSRYVSAGSENHVTVVAGKEIPLLDEICLNRNVPIVKVSQITGLIDDLEKKGRGPCSERYFSSFMELKPILTREPGKSMCDDEKFEQIKAYHFRYIKPLQEKYEFDADPANLPKVVDKNPMDEEKSEYKLHFDNFNQQVEIPQALQKFFKAWALQLSGHCKNRLVNNAHSAVVQFSSEDRKIFDDLKQLDVKSIPFNAGLNSGPIGATTKTNTGDNKQEIVNKSTGLQIKDLVHMPELEGEAQEGDIARRKGLQLDLTNHPKLVKFFQACKKRFKPVYSKLVLPIVRLAKLEYEYVGQKVDNFERILAGGGKGAEGEELILLLLITQICELYGDFELVNVEQDNEMPENNYIVEIEERFDDDMWIKSSKALSKELEKMRQYHSTGAAKLRYLFGRKIAKMFSYVDPMRFEFYRTNQNTIGSTLNVMSIISNTISSVLTVLSG